MDFLYIFVFGTYSILIHCESEQTNEKEMYYPPDSSDKTESWLHCEAADAGFDASRLADAVSFAKASEWSGCPRYADMEEFLIRGGMHGGHAEDDAHKAIVGPTKVHGACNGLIIRFGRIVAEWGDTNRVDMTFSVTKSYLSTMAGLAWSDGCLSAAARNGEKVNTENLEKVLDESVMEAEGPSYHSKSTGATDLEMNNWEITWRHLLQQTSEWHGTLWSKPDSGMAMCIDFALRNFTK